MLWLCKVTRLHWTYCACQCVFKLTRSMMPANRGMMPGTPLKQPFKLTAPRHTASLQVPYCFSPCMPRPLRDTAIVTVNPRAGSARRAPTSRWVRFL